MINRTREGIEFSYANCFRSIVLLVFALATALSKFCFLSLRDKIIMIVGFNFFVIPFVLANLKN